MLHEHCVCGSSDGLSSICCAEHRGESDVSSVKREVGWLGWVDIDGEVGVIHGQMEDTQSPCGARRAIVGAPKRSDESVEVECNAVPVQHIVRVVLLGFVHWG